MTLPITAATAAAILAIIQVFLMIAVGNKRRATSISFGDGGDADLLMRMRRHGNFIENAPMFLILLSLLEMLGGAPAAVTAFAGIFIVTRLSHAYALSGESNAIAFRVIGALGTAVSLLGTAGFILWQTKYVVIV
ncbi:MAPEG family protein [Kordiimonas aquimaris]|uniref:MAPEG family protein n=1 Tax=Kordiimonas aquimaris TaxID=707591 RepID=UPI0021D0565D|nr:MAPEG family protein [Kordiimonas aquimaris]